MAQQTCDQITTNFTDEYIASHFDETIIRVVICDSANPIPGPNTKIIFSYMDESAVIFMEGQRVSFMLE